MAFEWPSTVHFVDPNERGFERRRRGRGFVYVRPDGRRVRDRRTMLRIAAIAIPPAWSHVWIAPSAHAHLQATGRDARERKQYRYHPARALARREANYARLVDFARALPKIRAYVDAGLRRSCSRTTNRRTAAEGAAAPSSRAAKRPSRAGLRASAEAPDGGNRRRTDP